MSSEGQPRNVVLVHGGFVDGSGWQAVYDLLTKDGYRVAVVQNPTLSLADALGRGCARRDDQRSRVEDQAKLVPDRYGRPDDPPTRPAGHVRAGRLHRNRSGGQPLRLPVPARSGSGLHRPGSSLGRRVDGKL
jgi:hypothetical protein